MQRQMCITATLGVLILAIGVAAMVTIDTSRLSAQAPAPARSEPRIDYWEPLWMQRELWGPGYMPPGMRARVLRHTTYMQFGVQKEYEGARSTVGSTDAVIAAGAKLYGEKCASCHGKEGYGDGDAARALLPSPALLAYMIQRPISADEYLLWSISEGGKQFDTVMPAFKGTLSRDEIWKIIAYMRAGFRVAENDPPPRARAR